MRSNSPSAVASLTRAVCKDSVSHTILPSCSPNLKCSLGRMFRIQTLKIGDIDKPIDGMSHATEKYRSDRVGDQDTPTIHIVDKRWRHPVSSDEATARNPIMRSNGTLTE